MMQYSPIARIVTIDKGTKSAVVPCENAMSRISTAVAREDHLRVPTRPRRFREHSNNATLTTRGKWRKSRAGVALLSNNRVDRDTSWRYSISFYDESLTYAVLIYESLTSAVHVAITIKP